MDTRDEGDKCARCHYGMGMSTPATVTLYVKAYYDDGGPTGFCYDCAVKELERDGTEYCEESPRK